MSFSNFERDVVEGLSSTPKKLSSKYFYDEVGDRYFQQIMTLPEYYLTRKEYEIFQNNDLVTPLQVGKEGIDVFELGAGDGYKTRVLLQQLIAYGTNFTYRPIDISKSVLKQLENNLRSEMPEVEVKPIAGEYFKVLNTIKATQHRQKLILFLGSNIGNLLHPIAIEFLRELKHTMNQGDQALIGFDMKKDPDIILQAYNDPQGVTAAFNYNLLERINRELDANFNINLFRHVPLYNPESGTTTSYLMSLQEQVVKVGNHIFAFEQWETIHTEISQKYTHRVIRWLADQSGLQPLKYYSDAEDWFTDYLFTI